MRKIRILWLKNEPLPDLAVHLGLPIAFGGWLTALSQALVRTNKVELAVACRIPGGNSINITLGGIQYFTIPTSNVGYNLLRPTSTMNKCYKEIVNNFSPDVLHVHGTEWYGGLITSENRIGKPTIIALQGLIDHHRRHLLGQLGFIDILQSRTLREWILFSGLWKEQLQWNKRAVVEREIIRGHQNFEGRTLWDRAHLRRLNPEANFYFCNQIVRKEFYDREWGLSTINRHTIFASSSSYPLKGFHVLVKAAAILRREFPDVKVLVPLSSFTFPTGLKGSITRMKTDGYSNYLSKLIKQLDLSGHIIGLGKLSGEEMADEMQCAHVFALTSFVETNSNVMAEALTIGVPSVVSLVGGIPCQIDDGENVLGFPSGDEAVLAEQIRRIFLDDDLAMGLSKEGRKLARPKHSPEPIAKRIIEIYEALIRDVHPEHLEYSPSKYHDPEENNVFQKI